MDDSSRSRQRRQGLLVRMDGTDHVLEFAGYLGGVQIEQLGQRHCQ